MKFQNPSFNIFFEWTDAHTHARTDGRTSRKQYAPHFFKVGGIKSVGEVDFRKYSLLTIIHYVHWLNIWLCSKCCKFAKIHFFMHIFILPVPYLQNIKRIY